jgi:orotate phosphoribosyltransferase
VRIPVPKAEDITRLLPARRGHFVLESGHHGDLWLDLELLFLRPRSLRGAMAELGRRIAAHRPEVVCGPLVEGAFVALGVAHDLDLPFTYSVPERVQAPTGLFPVRYRVPRPQRPRLEGKRVAVVNDVINAGSAVRRTLEDLRSTGAEPVALAALSVLGEGARRLAEAQRLPLEALSELPSTIWRPEECPQCARGVRLSGTEGAGGGGEG